LPIAAVPYDTVPVPSTPWAPPGNYTVTLTANGKSYSQPLTVKQDPRVKTSALVMQQVYTLSTASYYEAVNAGQAARSAQDLRDQIAALGATGDVAKSLASFDAQLSGAGLAAASAGLSGAMNSLQAADVAPTAVQLQGITTARAAGTKAMAAWATLKTTGLAGINAKLTAAGLSPLTVK
jgi:hypothetical protein